MTEEAKKNRRRAKRLQQWVDTIRFDKRKAQLLRVAELAGKRAT